MIPTTVKIVQKGVGFTTQEWQPILAEAFKHAGQFWHRNILPKHFTVAGAQEYGYRERTKGYLEKKMHMFGHQRPLVFTGDMKREVTRIIDVRVTGRAHKTAADIVLHGPTHMFYARKNIQWEGDMWSVARELAKVSQKDADLVSEVIARNIEKQLRRSTKVRDITRGHRVAA